jgi:ribosomal protein L13E
MNDRDRFNKFTERARKVLSLAQEEAQRFNHNYIGTEHILLGLVREGEGVAAKVLSNLGVELNAVRTEVETIIGRGDRIVLGEIGLTPRAKKVIELAVDESRRLNHHFVGTEHMLLGLVREGEGIAAGVLKQMGVDLEQARTQTIGILSQASAILEARRQAAPIGTQARSATRSMTIFPHQYEHITSEARNKTPIGKRARGASEASTMLGWVIINTGGAFTLTLYHGMADDAPRIAVITNPPTGAYFPYYCPLEQGLAYTLSGTPGSISVIYGDVPAE